MDQYTKLNPWIVFGIASVLAIMSSTASVIVFKMTYIFASAPASKATVAPLIEEHFSGPRIWIHDTDLPYSCHNASHCPDGSICTSLDDRWSICRSSCATDADCISACPFNTYFPSQNGRCVDEGACICDPEELLKFGTGTIEIPLIGTSQEGTYGLSGELKILDNPNNNCEHPGDVVLTDMVEKTNGMVQLALWATSECTSYCLKIDDHRLFRAIGGDLQNDNNWEPFPKEDVMPIVSIVPIEVCYKKISMAPPLAVTN